MSDLATTLTVIDACGRAGVTPLLTGDPGLGKTSVVRALAAAEGVPCEVVLGSIREPADVAGLPVVTDEGVMLSPPGWARRLVTAGCGYLLLDEVGSCPPSVQSALLAVALDRTVGDVRLPGQVRVVAGSNPPDRAADGYDLAPPLANRFCHIAFTPTVDDFIEGTMNGWGAPPPSRAVSADALRAQSVKAGVIGFVRVRPELLHAYPTDADATGGPWPSRRTWTMLIGALAHLRAEDAAARQAVTFGLVGEGAGVEFLEWVAAADLPDPASVIADPSGVDWTGRPDRVWTVLSGVVAWTCEQGTQAAWREAWTPLLAAADAGAVDVAAAAARSLNRARPSNARPPVRVREVFAPVLAQADLAVPA